MTTLNDGEKAFNYTEIEFDNKDNKDIHKDSPLNMTLDLTYKIPSSVNYIAIRESFLSEAPFVKKGGGGLWRRLIDAKCFYDMLCATYNLCSNCISHSGSFNVQEFKSVDSQQIQAMAINFADIYYQFSSEERDIFMPKLPEVMLYMLVNCLHSGMPKHYRMFNSLRFREIVIDHFGELYAGIRPTSISTGREWLYEDCNDIPIFLTAPDYKKDPDVNVSSASSRYRLSNSLLVNLRLGPHVSQNYDRIVGMRMTMSHLPTRPLMTLTPSRSVLNEGKARTKHFNTDRAKQSIKQTNNIKKKVLNKQIEATRSMRLDLHRSNEHHEDMLKVFKKEEKEAMLKLESENANLRARKGNWKEQREKMSKLLNGSSTLKTNIDIIGKINNTNIGGSSSSRNKGNTTMNTSINSNTSYSSPSTAEAKNGDTNMMSSTDVTTTNSNFIDNKQEGSFNKSETSDERHGIYSNNNYNNSGYSDVEMMLQLKADRRARLEERRRMKSTTINTSSSNGDMKVGTNINDSIDVKSDVIIDQSDIKEVITDVNSNDVANVRVTTNGDIETGADAKE